MNSLEVAKAVQEVIDVILITTAGSTGVSIDVQIRSSAQQAHDPDDQDLIFLIKVSCSDRFSIEDFYEQYEKSLKEFSCMILEMQQIENESHLNICFMQNDQLVKKFYTVCDEDNGMKLKCTGTRTKSSEKQGTVLHIRVFQNKRTMMIQCRALYQHLKCVSLCSQVNLSLSLTVQDNKCTFNLRSNVKDDSDCCVISNDAEYFLAESYYKPSQARVEIQSSSKVALPNDHHLPAMNLMLQAFGYQVLCKSATQSIATLNLFGLGCLPVSPCGIPSNHGNSISLLLDIDWQKYKFTSVEEGVVSVYGGIPVHDFVELTQMEQGTCFVVALFLFIDGNVADKKEKLRTLRWLRENVDIWTNVYRNQILSTLTDAMDKILSDRKKLAIPNITKLYTDAVSCISKSVSSIVKHSCNEKFRKKCSELLELQSSDNRTVEMAVYDRLLGITQSLGVPLLSKPCQTVSTLSEQKPKRESVAKSNHTSVIQHSSFNTLEMDVNDLPFEDNMDSLLFEDCFQEDNLPLGIKCDDKVKKFQSQNKHSFSDDVCKNENENARAQYMEDNNYPNEDAEQVNKSSIDISLEQIHSIDDFSDSEVCDTSTFQNADIENIWYLPRFMSNECSFSERQESVVQQDDFWDVLGSSSIELHNIQDLQQPSLVKVQDLPVIRHPSDDMESDTCIIHDRCNLDKINPKEIIRQHENNSYLSNRNDSPNTTKTLTEKEIASTYDWLDEEITKLDTWFSTE